MSETTAPYGTTKRPETGGAKRAREAQDAFGKAHGLTVVKPTTVNVSRGTPLPGAAATPEKPSKGQQRDERIGKRHDAEKESAKSAGGKTTVTKTKTTEKPATKTERFPSKVAEIVESMRTKDETRYAKKVWRFLAGKRSSTPAKYGLAPARAASIYKKVQAVV